MASNTRVAKASADDKSPVAKKTRGRKAEIIPANAEISLLLNGKAAISYPKMALIRDKAALAKFTDETINLYVSVHQKLHVAALSNIWFVAKHGNPATLQVLYNGLKRNDQTALRLFTDRLAVIVGLNILGINAKIEDRLDQAVITKARMAGKFLDMKQGTFSVVSDTVKARDISMDMIEKRFINPDGVTDHLVFDRDNFTEVRTLNDVDMLSAIVRVAKQLESTSETRKLAVTHPVAKFIKEVGEKASSMVKQVTLAEG